ncbi:MAG: Gfo/Idh/MocA family oxidoreductase [Verrucomicrobia bacterium]|nr:Gfo/Idh/MocA family oxidoreductase [Verrucomicrobiota bacterium]
MKRREFLRTVAAGVGGLSVLDARGQSAAPAKKPLRVALIGCGGQGVGTLLPQACNERVVALADPDPRCIEAALAKIRKVAPSADTAAIKTFSDYRKLFDVMGRELDAAVIATPNHQHAPPALMAIRRGIHVYVEKPLTHTIHEARLLRDEAKRCGVVTQMGQHGHSNEGCRRLCEYIWAGAIGQVRENGSVGNWGCHLIDPSYWALKLKSPEAVEVEDMHGGIGGVWPIRTRIRWDFPAREGMDPVKVYFYDGLAADQQYSEQTVLKRWRNVAKREWQNLPPLVLELEKKYKRDFGRAGSLLVGDKGIMTIGEFGDGCRIVPEEAHRAFPMPDKLLPRIKGSHQSDFFRACRGGVPACANFDYSAPLAEIALLGDIAMLAGLKRRVEWDGAAMRCTNRPELNRFLKPSCRDGWKM